MGYKIQSQLLGINTLPGEKSEQIFPENNLIPKISDNSKSQLFVDESCCSNCCIISKTSNADLYQVCSFCLTYGKIHRDNVIGNLFTSCCTLASCLYFENFNMDAIINYIYLCVFFLCACTYGKRESSYFSYFCCLACTTNLWCGEIKGCGFNCCCCCGYDAGLCCDTPCCLASNPKYCKTYCPFCTGFQVVEEK